MSPVVLRCPACGTTQSHPGECDACSEGEVRFFCSNHTPGRWVDAPVCGGCGAKFGESPAAVPPVSTPTRSSVSPRRPDSRSPVPPVIPSPHIEPPRRPDAADPEESSDPPSLADVLVDMLEEGERTRRRAEAPPFRMPTVEAPGRPRPLFGCLGRAVLLGLLLLSLAISVLVAFLGSFLG